MNYKKFGSIAVLLILLVSLMASFISSYQEVTTIPDGMSQQDFMNLISSENSPQGLLSIFLYHNWYACGSFEFPYSTSECNPCPSGSIASNCVYSCYNGGDQISKQGCTSMSTCSSPFVCGSSNGAKACYCSQPVVQCSGGYDIGERKCSGDVLMECKSGGVFSVVEDCDYGCSGSRCQEQSCFSQDSYKCSGGDVYWYNSCGQKEGIKTDCSSGEECQTNKCVQVCQQGFVGDKTCVGSKLFQNYLKTDCSSEQREIESCTYGCSFGSCNQEPEPTCSDNKPTPSDWSICMSEKKTRTNYKCDSSTDYEWNSFTESQDCECSVDSQCEEYQSCENEVCLNLECDEGEIAQGNKCISAKPNYLVILSIILVPVLFLLFFLVLFLFIRRRTNVQRIQK